MSVQQQRVGFRNITIPARHQPLYDLFLRREKATKVETKLKCLRHMVGVHVFS